MIPLKTIQNAADLLELGMYAEAFELAENLPEDIRDVAAARRVRLRAATALGRWQLAIKLAVSLKLGNEADRREAAAAFHTLASEACKRGRDAEARQLIGAAIAARPAQLETILTDERFPEKFRQRLG